MDSLSIVQRFFPDVEVVKDASRNVTIEVTKKDINSSQVKNLKSCAIAQACKRAMHLDGVVISRSIAYLVKDKHAIRYVLSDAATKEIIAFDRGGSFEPGEYKLHKPHDAIAINSGHQAPTSRNKKRAKRGSPRHLTANIRMSLVGGGK